MNKVILGFAALSAVLLFLGTLGYGQASEPVATDPLDLNPATGCMEGVFDQNLSESDRLVPAAAIIESLRGGNCVRLDNAIVQGELDLTSLPINSIDSQGQNLIALPGAFIATNSVFEAEFNAATTRGIGVQFSGPAVFTGTRFSTVDLTGAHFVQDAHFENALFSQNAKFEGIQFEGHARFNRAQFDKTAMFSNLKVNGDLDFDSATFSSLVRAFGGSADRLLLSNATFKTSTDFSRWQANHISGEDANFGHTLNTGSSKWLQTANFTNARFGGNADFDNSVFSGEEASFFGAAFEKNADFSRSRFFALSNFSRVAFQVNVVFKDVEFFENSVFAHSNFGLQVQFLGAKFHELADFTSASFDVLNFKNATFYKAAPELQDATFAGELVLEGLRSYLPWKTDSGIMEDALANEPYFVFDEVLDPRLGRMQRHMQLLLLGVAAVAAGVVVLLALEFF